MQIELEHQDVSTDAAEALWLVPTAMEQNLLIEFDPRFSSSKVIGFGLIESMMGAKQAIEAFGPTRPKRVFLVGIAGAFDTDRFPLGTALRFRSVHLDGIGVGLGTDHQSAAQLGWIETKRPGGESEHTAANESPGLLSVCAASADPSEARWRRERFAECVAEDMETFAVARLCQSEGIKLTCIRGISNQVGDRDHRRWKTRSALQSVAKYCERLRV